MPGQAPGAVRAAHRGLRHSFWVDIPQIKQIPNSVNIAGRLGRAFTSVAAVTSQNPGLGSRPLPMIHNGSELIGNDTRTGSALFQTSARFTRGCDICARWAHPRTLAGSVRLGKTP